MTALDVHVVVTPAVFAALLAYTLRRHGAPTMMLVGVLSYPAFYVVTVILTLLISYQVFGVDLVD